jgi:hypothetical protein
MRRISSAWLSLAVSVFALLLPSFVRAESSPPGALRLGVDLGLGLGMRYEREIEAVSASVRPDPSVQGALSVHGMFSRYAGIGFQVSGAAVPLDDDGLLGNTWALDLGPSPMLRLPLGRADLTVRLPFGLTFGNAITRDTGWAAFAAQPQVWSTSDKMGPGYHVAALVGAAFWATPRIAVRLETGPWWRRYTVHEGATVAVGNTLFGPTVERDVNARLLTWLVQLGFEWAPG